MSTDDVFSPAEEFMSTDDVFSPAEEFMSTDDVFSPAEEPLVPTTCSPQRRSHE